ncbi:MAG TPA: polyprenyl diphosphate synthase [Bdellovibrionota bacterium]|jgi:undecaprenyl diphosphate synthase|nr:polyprenyl diphosphate synthase [Bdellovibrionota bacterium]
MKTLTPRHVAIVMDGNGRWAQRRGRPRIWGHIRGAGRVKDIVRGASDNGVKALTLFAFSTENWARPEAELAVLWKLLKKFLSREVDELHRQNVRLHVLGEIERLAPDVRQVVNRAVERLAGNTGLRLCFAVSYGSRREVARAARRFAEDCASGLRKPADLDEALLSTYLWTAELGDLQDVDLVIRTSGELRTSNFLLWQSAYAEYYFTDTCWPDFDAECFGQALRDYGTRERRFGQVGDRKDERSHGIS